jgi:large repetitive protein
VALLVLTLLALPGSSRATPATPSTVAEIAHAVQPPTTAARGGPVAGAARPIALGTSSSRVNPPEPTTTPLTFRGGIDPATGVVPLNVTFFLLASGGEPPYSYAVSFGDGGRSELSNDGQGSTVHLYTSAGVHQIEIVLTDSMNTSVIANETVSVLTFPLTAEAPTLAPSSIDIGRTTNLSVAVSGGTGIYTYSWLGLPEPCASVNGSELSCTPEAVGSSTISVRVTDSALNMATSSAASLQVAYPPRIATISTSPEHVDLGQASYLTVSLSSDGAVPLLYQWTGLPPGCPAADLASIPCVASTLGTFDVGLTVTDSEGASVSGIAVPLSIFPALIVAPPVASRTTLETGQSVVLLTSATGGLAAYSYNWSGLPAECGVPLNSSVSCTPSSAGNLTVSVAVTDANDNIVRAGEVNLTVLPAVRVVAEISPDQIDVGQSAEVDVRVTGGAGPFELTYIGLPTECSALSATQLTCTSASPGQFYVVVVALDELGGIASTIATLEVIVPATPATAWTLELIELGLNAAGIVAIGILLLELRRRPPVAQVARVRGADGPRARLTPREPRSKRARIGQARDRSP